MSLLISGNALAKDESITDAFLTAEKMQYDRRLKKVTIHDERLLEYPLLPYIEQKFLLKHTKLANKSHFERFLKQYNGTPLDWPVRKKWLEYLAGRNKQKLFLEFFKPTSNARLSCLNLRFQLNQGQNIASLSNQVSGLWLNGESQPKECDPLFKKWQQAGYRTDALVMERIILAATKGKHTLIPYLTRLLPDNKKPLASLWHNTRRNPSYIKRYERFENRTIAETDVLVYGLKRLIWRSPNDAVSIFEKSQRTFPYSQYQIDDITSTFAIALASKKHEGSHYWLHKVPRNQLNGKLVQWLIADALRKGDWLTVRKELEQLPENLKQELKWQYWLARAYEQTNESEKAQQIYQRISTTRHYYGFLASGQLNQPISLTNNPIMVTAKEKSLLAIFPSHERAYELHKLKRYTQARREWNYLMTKLTEPQKLAAAQLAYERQWYDRAIFTLSDVGYMDDIELRFPKAFSGDIERYSQVNKVNPAWTYAIARRESAFMVDAYSHAGARGLMQMLPSTAKQMKEKAVSKNNLMKAKININLGTKYLNYLMSRHDGNPLLATAAYNAGSYRVKSWLKSQPAVDADIWIETIPYKETRDYVKSVMAYQQIYQLKAGDTSSLFKTIAAMDISE